MLLVPFAIPGLWMVDAVTGSVGEIAGKAATSFTRFL